MDFSSEKNGLTLVFFIFLPDFSLNERKMLENSGISMYFTKERR